MLSCWMKIVLVLPGAFSFWSVGRLVVSLRFPNSRIQNSIKICCCWKRQRMEKQRKSSGKCRVCCSRIFIAEKFFISSRSWKVRPVPISRASLKDCARLRHWTRQVDEAPKFQVLRKEFSWFKSHWSGNCLIKSWPYRGEWSACSALEQQQQINEIIN